MATYTSELDSALLPVPWMAKVDANSKAYMLKHASHPTKPGFITLLTDLTKVYFEPLAGIRVLARQREVEEKFGQSQSQRDGASSLDLGGEEAVDEVLEEVKALMEEMEDLEMEVKAGDLYDLDVTIKSPRGNWLYHMTEIRTDCLEIMTRHIVHPLALSIASSRRPNTTTTEQIVELVSSSTVLGAINRHSLHSNKSSSDTTKVKSPKKATSGSSIPPAGVEKEDSADKSKSRLVRRRPGAGAKPEDAGPSSPERTTRNKSPTPIETMVSRSMVQEDAEDESMPPEEEDEDHRLSTPGPTASSPARSGKQKASPVPTDEEMDEGKSPTPPAPIPSQKTQQEKDEEEEEDLAKKREEMKRKMGAGRGGRLVRRRFG